MTLTEEEIEKQLDEYYGIKLYYQTLSIESLLKARDNLRKTKLDSAKRLDIIAAIFRDRQNELQVHK